MQDRHSPAKPLMFFDCPKVECDSITRFIQLLHCNVECRDEIAHTSPQKSVCFIITDRGPSGVGG
jgi:hypothetical protein